MDHLLGQPGLKQCVALLAGIGYIGHGRGRSIGPMTCDNAKGGGHQKLTHDRQRHHVNLGAGAGSVTPNLVKDG
jgi:hypothetical protein